MDIRLPLPAALRDRVATEESLWAYVISLVISPPLVWAIWVYAITAFASDNRSSALFFASIFVFSICILPILFVAYKVRNGKISDLNMRESNERYIPYSIAIVAGIISELIFVNFGAEPIIILVTLVSIVELTMMLIGTFFIHISLHAMAMASIISATALMYGFSRSLFFVPVLLLVILARLVLKRHTPAQILIGVLIGVLSPLLVVLALGQFL